jgi:molybdate/tungstate transport system substrate-binding protein
VKHALSFSCTTFVAVAALLPTLAASAQTPMTLTIFAAGTLAVPFRQVSAIYERKYPEVTVQAQFGGSVMMAKKITDLHQDADLLAVADYNVIRKYMFGTPAHAAWYAGFARNAITFVYTDKSKYAGEINAENWYTVLARKGVEIGRSDPDTDPPAIRPCRC